MGYGRERSDWVDALHAWESAAVGAGRAPTTIRLRLYYLRRFADDAPSGPWQMTPDDVSTWLAQPDWKPETRKSARASLRVFYRWAQKTGRCEVDPTSATDSIRVPRGVPHPTPEQVLNKALMSSSPRVRLMILLAAYGGLRRAEIARMHADDFDRNMMRVTGKGGVERWVPVHHRIAAELPADVSGWLFPGDDGGHVAPDRVGRLVSAALGPSWTCHTLRHRFGTALYAGTGDLLKTQQVLGHASPTTTQRYVDLPRDGVASAIQAIA